MSSGYLFLLMFLCLLSFAAIRFEGALSKGLKWNQSPYTWFVAGWIPGLILLVLPIYDYPEEFTFSDAAYVGGVHACFVFGMLMSAVFRHKTADRSIPGGVSYLLPNIVLGMIVVGVIGQVLYAADAQMSGNISFGQRVLGGDFQAIKNQYLDINAKSALLGPFFIANNYICALGQIGLIAFSVASSRHLSWGAKQPLLKPFVIVLFLLMAFNSLFVSGGRLSLMLTALFVAIPWTLPGRPKKVQSTQRMKIPLKWVVAGGVAIVAVVYLSTAFVSGRIGRHDVSVDLQLTHRARFTETVENLVGDNRSVRNSLFQASYLSTPLPTLTRYLHQDDKWFPPHYGNMNFSVLYQLLGKVIPGFEPEAEAAIQASNAPLLNAGYFSNVWTTMLREVLVDFGKIGALIFFVIFGFISGIATWRYYRGPTIERGMWLTFIRCQLIFSAFHSLLYHRVFGFALLLGILVMMASAIPTLWRHRRVTPRRLRVTSA